MTEYRFANCYECQNEGSRQDCFNLFLTLFRYFLSKRHPSKMTRFLVIVQKFKYHMCPQNNALNSVRTMVSTVKASALLAVDLRPRNPAAEITKITSG